MLLNLSKQKLKEIETWWKSVGGRSLKSLSADEQREVIRVFKIRAK
jgi:hypothetical protein